MAAVAYAATTTVFDRDNANNETEGQLVRVTSELSTTIIDTASVKWKVYSQSRFYEDSGEQKLRLTHELQANIFYSDSIQFELAYRPESQPAPTDATALGLDFVRCQLSNDSSDRRYWSATLIDGKYACGGSDPTDRCKDVTLAEVTETSEPSTDWVTPFSDEPDGTESPWCSNASTVGQPESDYACTKIKCYMERPFDTGDATNDYPFAPTDSQTNDKLLIAAGFANLEFNPTSDSKLSNYDDIEIEVALGALSGIGVSLAAVSVYAASVMF
jgi:hypothetical protein